MYRNCYYDAKNNKVMLWTWNGEQERITVEVDFSPYLYIPCPKDKSTIESIYGDPLKKRVFDTEKDRREYIELRNGESFFNLPPEQQFLLEKFGEEPIEKMTQYPLKVFAFDIEVDCGDVFPTPAEAKFPINVITVHDSIDQKFHVFGINPYDEYSIKDELGGQVDSDKIEYIKCSDEKELLKMFIRFWRKDFPDVVVGWNSANFDIPYIMNRMKKLYGDQKINVFSPVGKVRSKTSKDKFGKESEEFVIEGVSCLDYMLLYRSYALKELESVALNHIASVELGIGKVEYNQVNLSHLAHENWNKFVNYNIQDVNIILMLEDKLRYLEIARFIANSGFCNIEKAIGKVAVITGILAQRALHKNQIIPTNRNSISEETREKIPGGYVKEPIAGYYEHLCSFDANSLYPNIMITLNISPETKVGKIHKVEDEKYSISYKNKKATVSREQLDQLVKEKGLSLSRAGIMFTQDYKGIGPEFVDELYQKRKIYKNKMLAAEKGMENHKKGSVEYNKLNRERIQCNVTQQLYKVLLNSTYGVFANPHFCMFDLECAKSITLTGQAMIKQAEKICNEWSKDKGMEKDSIVYVDTDSVFLHIEELTKDIKKLDDDGNMSKEFLELSDDCQDNLNKKIDQWAKVKLNSKDSRFFFKMEKYTEKMVMIKKKHYILKVRNDEGVKCDKFVIKGLLLVKSSLSPKIRNKGKDIVKMIFDGATEKEVKAELYKMYDDFKNYTLDEIAFRISLKTMDTPSYVTAMNGLQCEKSARVPSQVACAYRYNYLIKQSQLDGKYPLFVNGMKAKLIYLSRNKYGLNRIAYVSEFPSELDLEPDWTLTFGKTVEACLKSIFDTIGWAFPNIQHENKNDLEELLA